MKTKPSTIRLAREYTDGKQTLSDMQTANCQSYVHDSLIHSCNINLTSQCSNQAEFCDSDFTASRTWSLDMLSSARLDSRPNSANSITTSLPCHHQHTPIYIYTVVKKCPPFCSTAFSTNTNPFP